MQITQSQQTIVLEILNRHGSAQSDLLPILHSIQDTLGFIPPEAAPHIAEALNLSKAEVHGVISFYHYFRDTPPGKHTVHVCRAESCQSMNGRQLEKHAKQYLGIDFHQTTDDGEFSLEPIYCLGNCAASPAISLNGEVHGRVSTEKFDQLIAACKGSHS